MRYGTSIIIQKQDEETEKWTNVCQVFSTVPNKAAANSEYLKGADIEKVSKTFKVRYTKIIADIEYNTTLYRIIWDDHIYDIRNYDDYKNQHKSVTLLGVAHS